MKINNNLLAGLVIVSIIIGIAGIYTASSAPSPASTPSGYATGVANVTIPSSVQISLPVSQIDFGNLNISDSDDTSDLSPAPFEIQNDGSVNVNVTVYATDMFNGSGAANPSSYYQFQSAESETGSTVDETSDLVTTWTNMPNSTAPATFGRV
ncbi:MAG: hypothetical protein R6U26_00290 [Candidatus Undinarchaeales archaeon]